MKKLLLPFLFILLGMDSNAQSVYFPPTTGSTWETMAPSELGWCQDSIAALIDYLDDEQSKAFIVLKDGKMVIEHYFDTFTQDSLWYWASAGKSLTAFLVGRAQEEGLLSISDKTSDHLGTGWTSAPSNKEDLITIRHQLSMTTGLDDGTGNADCTTPSCLQYLSDAGTRWAYHNAPYTLTHAVVEAASGLTFNQFTNTYIKQQTGMNGLWFMTGDNDVFFSTARSMARFGLLMQNNGVWAGDTVMHDQQYMYDMTHSSQNLNESYGYLWWLGGQNSFMIPSLQTVFPGAAVPSAPSDMFAALGKNGQIASISPSEGLVVIRMGNSNGSGLVSLELTEGIWSRLNGLSCSSGISESEATGIGIYPNPASNTITVSGNSIQNGATVTIFNSLGQSQIEFLFSAGESIDVSNLAEGVYVLRIVKGQTSYTARFLKE
ncbi:MAG: serine hydrolase [Flavobacteriales bacterium]|nr:serine hydrolase [Flavobacteriales bacterium]